MPGKMIVIDGNDGSGKQTQAGMLQGYLANRDCKVMKISFPRYEETFFGNELKKALAGSYGDFLHLDPHLAAIPYAADRWQSTKEIQEFLASGGYVICDRYATANQIHQGGKIDDEAERVEFISWLEMLEYGVFGIQRPDICVYLDVPPEVAEKLMSDKTRDIVENNPQYLRNSYLTAQWLIKRNPRNWIHINCMHEGQMRPKEDIHGEIGHWLYEQGFIF